MSDERIESHEDRIYVLRDKAAREGFTVPDDALEYILLIPRRAVAIPPEPPRKPR